MGRKILCEACGSILNEEILKQKNSLNTCLVCGASLGMEEAETAPEEELVTWYYYRWKTSDSCFIIEKQEAEKQNLPDNEDEDIILEYKFQAPHRDENGDCDAAKEILRREYKPDAFTESSKCTITKPDALWIAEGKCPRCHSSNIQLVPRKFSIWTGFRTNKVDRVCVNCKHRF